EVSLDDAGEIMAIDIVEHSETDDIADPALEEIPAAIIESQSTDVDAVSEATVTSEAIMEAVAAALDKEENESAEEDAESEDEEAEPEANYEDGTYTATGEGYNDEIEIEVEIADEKIDSIEILNHDETEDIAEPAFEDLIEAAKLEQSSEIDAVSGATGSSEGFIEALEEVLNNAIK
ncbi:MAG: FMN-binding protein, partial [Bacillota bacterium]